MLRLRVIAVGKLKEAYLRDACAEYAKRISRFAELKLVELLESRLPETPSDTEIQGALRQEAAAIIKACEGYVIALCIEGKQLSSETFAARLSALAVQGQSTVTLLIGSSHGLSDVVKQRADFCFSMSPMTFPHQLARVMLLEQLYRAMQIANGGKYHK